VTDLRDGEPGQRLLDHLVTELHTGGVGGLVQPVGVDGQQIPVPVRCRRGRRRLRERLALASLPLADDDTDLVGLLPGVSSSVTIRVIDTDRTGGNRDVDTVSIDELFVRAVP
jgi:hypothetical protein